MIMTKSRLESEILPYQGIIWSTIKDDLQMSFCQNGLDAKVKSQIFAIKVPKEDIYVQLANAIDWEHVAALALQDLEKTEKGFFWRGRKINLRTHLSVLILQPLLRETDRGIEELINQTPRFQAFCGKGIVPKWKCPDHTKLEVFRNRLSPETHKKIGDYVLQLAQQLGFADPSWMDVDSTIQEANMAYPSDASLMKKLSGKCKKVLDYLVFTGKKYLPENLSINMKAITKKAQEYFFLAKNAGIEKRRELFKEYHKLVKGELRESINFLEEKLTSLAYGQLPWNIQMAIDQIRQDGWRYLLDVGHFVRTHSIKMGKVLAFHCKNVSCFSKGKAGKDHEFGRNIQLGRIGGNFIVPMASTNIRMEDKKSLIAAVEGHQEIFGSESLKEVGTDKGYYSKKNIKTVERIGINADGIQRTRNCKNQPPQEVVSRLRDRRSGIEPLIGHVKKFGLGKSRMKKDDATLASGYRSAMGFNLHQMKRKMAEKREKRAA